MSSKQSMMKAITQAGTEATKAAIMAANKTKYPVKMQEHYNKQQE